MISQLRALEGGLSRGALITAAKSICAAEDLGTVPAADLAEAKDKLIAAGTELHMIDSPEIARATNKLIQLLNKPGW